MERIQWRVRQMPGPNTRPDSIRVRCSQQLELLAHLLFVLFLLLCLVPLWPIRVFDAGWLISLGHQILRRASLVLIGITILELARSIAPWRRHLVVRHGLVLAIARRVSLGFVLMIPLQILLAWLVRPPIAAAPLLLMNGVQPLQIGGFQPGVSHGLIALVYGVAFHWIGHRRP